ncbi:hypothetical protein EDB86DRAFT_999534 [Lactarius hatsudake]|nr:hypothetical protein EDB86DRAFT_999534 [Lactarius hatsudake]
MSGQDRCQQRRMRVSVIVDKIVEFNLELAIVDGLEDAVSPLAIFGTKVFINVVLRYQCVDHRSANIVKHAYLYPRDDVVFILNVRIQVQVQIVIELPLVVKLFPHHILDGPSDSPTAKPFKARGIARQAHVSAGDLEDEARIRLEDADEDKEEDESASSSNVNSELELADGVRGIPAAEGEDEGSFAEDNDDGTSDGKEVTQKESFPNVRKQSSHRPQCPGPRACPRCRPPCCPRPRPRQRRAPPQ